MERIIYTWWGAIAGFVTECGNLNYNQIDNKENIIEEVCKVEMPELISVKFLNEITNKKVLIQKGNTTIITLQTIITKTNKESTHKHTILNIEDVMKIFKADTFNVSKIKDLSDALLELINIIQSEG